MTTLFYRNARLLILTLVLIVVWGVSSFVTLPRLEDPEINQRSATVTTLFPGASSDRVEALVTEVIEQELSEIEEIDTLESASSLGISIVTINLKETVSDVEPVWQRVRSKVDDAVPQLPEGALEPRYEDQEVKANALILGLLWETDAPVNYGILRRWAKTLEDRLGFLPGTDQVEVFGDPQEEIQVVVRQSDLAQLGLTTQELAQQVQASDAKVSAGQLRNPNQNLVLELSNELDSLERIRTIPIRTATSGQVAQLGDIAQVDRRIREPADHLALVSGKPAIVLAATVESAQRIDQWMTSARETLKVFQTELPAGIAIATLLDQSKYVNTRVNGVMRELLIGSILATLVITVMMGWRSALVVGIASPLACLLVFGWMRLLGVPIHQMSLTGLIIAIGLLIDNAIVMVDEVQIRLHQGMAPVDAIADSTRRMALPLSSSTLTTVLAFMPITLQSGSVGEFTGTIGLSGILGLTSSLLISLTVLPALSGILHRWQPSPKLPHWAEQGLSIPQLTRWYRHSLQSAFRRPMGAIALSLILPVMGFAVTPHLNQQFFPPTGRDQFYIDFELSEQTALAQTQAQALEARSLILQHASVLDVHWFLGKSAPTFYYNVIGKRENESNYAQGWVQLRPGVLPAKVIQTLQTELNDAFPAARVVVRQIEQGPPYDAPIEVRLYGGELNTLRQLGEQVQAEVLSLRSNSPVGANAPVIHTRATLTEAQPKLAVTVDEVQARLVGLDRMAIARQLDSTLEGTTGGSILEQTEELPVRVRLSDVQRADLPGVTGLDLVTGDRQSIPFATVGDVSLVPDFPVIARRNGRRVNTVQVFLTAGILPATVQHHIEQRLHQLQFPPGYIWEFGGESAERSESIANLLSTVGVLTVLMVATLVLTFNSFTLAASIGAIALLSAGLGLLALWISGYPFGFTAILGTIGLIGIAVNEATVVVSALQNDELASSGNLPATQAVVIHATRHLVATTITDIAGFIPLLFDPTGFWNPLAIVIAGGLGGVTLLSIYFVPAIFLKLRPLSSSRIAPPSH
ncbi:efflux RND transporter permease subunit [Oscillatoria sp. FACHB-1407]|uniref:efflux RND transporter permease subunit n=1 Tax=Oscillatoria sp. FACHB-1407 TaxID=2692847 RepID=UPI001683341C|nr:efflux RND transporter permease subunit [Oscillatoria sp. FACHB-1407]MBD2465251.1 efflux RND transporter permease subunit [Oscillatoria sp. FACHB-1407]